MKRADDAIGLATKFIEQTPNTLRLTTVDSDAGGLEVLGEKVEEMPVNQNLPATNQN